MPTAEPFEPAEPLRRGDRVAVISPSGTFRHEHLDRGLERLRQRYDVVVDRAAKDRAGFLAGTDAERARALLDALDDDGVKAIFVARGGYGCARLLEHTEHLLPTAVRRARKPIVGFSDLSVLHARWWNERVPSVHGPMIAALGRGNVRDEDFDETCAMLEGGVAASSWRGLESIVPGDAEGLCAGGNLAVLCTLLGTHHMPDFAGAVLFLEDITEKPFRIDRMLTSMRLAGALRDVAAVVLGEWTDCEAGPDGVTAREVLTERLASLGVPVLAGAPFGHGAVNRPIPFGARASVSSDGSIEFGR